jgi:hypothetical protein
MTLQFFRLFIGVLGVLLAGVAFYAGIEWVLRWLGKTRVSVRAPGTKVVYISKRKPLIEEFAERARLNVISGTRGRQ